MIWFFYNILFSVVYLLMLPKFIGRMLKRGGYAKGFMERFGVYNDGIISKLRDGNRIWVHAVSVGEMYIALRFIEEVRTKTPDRKFIITVTTSTGHKIAEKAKHPDDVLVYFPSDFPFAVKRVVRKLSPEMLVLVENELWPNLLRYVKRADIPVVLINGRISDSSFRGYSKLKFVTRRALPLVDLFFVQTEMDKLRLVELGAPVDKIMVMGSAKYDVVKEDTNAAERARVIMDKAGIDESNLVLLGGSTWPGEELALLEIFKDLKDSFPKLKLVLVPRHAERRAEVENDIRQVGLDYTLRSNLDVPDVNLSDILLVDTTGELRDLYYAATVIFVGKSLGNNVGGQNIIEPALAGKPIIAGPHLENFPDVAKDFLSAKALIQVRDAEELRNVLQEMFADKSKRDEYGSRARLLIPQKRGVLNKTVDKILSVFSLK